jgi:predicted transcriptional regulator
LQLDVLRSEVTMPSAKEQIAKILQDQPDDSSHDEILRELAFARMIEKGLADSDAGRTISHEEMGRRIKTAKPRADWAKAAKRMRAQSENRLIDQPTPTRFDKDEWKWR